MLTFDFSEFPILETPRLLLRRLADKDAPEIFALRSDPKSMKYIPRPLATSIDDALSHIALINKGIDENQSINWAITLKGSDKLIGIIGLYRTEFENFRSEIGYMVLPEFAGTGIATEAISAIVRYGFEKLGLHSIEAVIDPDNIASERVLQKIGFVKEAHFKENAFYDGKFIDSAVYTLLDRNAPKAQ